MSYLTQMAGMTVQNFVSATVGMGGDMAIIRGFSRAEARTVGNFWVDLTRSVLYILLPICIIGSLVLVWQDVPQNLDPYVTATTLEGGQQVIAQGPGRLADDNQASGHEWRRFLQRERRAPL